MGRIVVLVSFLGWGILALVILAAILALAGVDRFEPSVANPPT